MPSRLAYLASQAARSALSATLAATLSVASAAATAAPSTLQFEAHTHGVPTRLTLQVDGTQVSGQVDEPGIRLLLEGRSDGERVDARLRDPATGLALVRLMAQVHPTHLDATLTPLLPGAAPTRLRFLPVANAEARTSPAPDAVEAKPITPQEARLDVQLDARLVGRWVHQSMINSGGGAGGFASFTTERVLEFGADGRVQQTVRSVGGGGNWSAHGGRQVEFSGTWQVRGPQVWVRADGQTSFQSAGTYRFAGEYLVTEGGGGRRVWQR